MLGTHRTCITSGESTTHIYQINAASNNAASIKGRHTRLLNDMIYDQVLDTVMTDDNTPKVVQLMEDLQRGGTTDSNVRYPAEN